jgi:hypothetical protein
MPEPLPADLPNSQIRQAASGRWWCKCTRRGCTFYTSGLASEDYANVLAGVHQRHHENARRR